MTVLVTPEILEPLGFGRIDATVLSYLIDMKKTTSREIEHACRLRQPEVCNSLQRLAEEGFVTYAKKKKEGKGRPTHIYKAKSNILELLALSIGQKRNELTSDIEKLDEITRIINQRQKEQ